MGVDVQIPVVSGSWEIPRPGREVHPVLRPVLPGGLKPGVYSVTGVTSVAFGLLVDGWCGAVGMPELGVEAAHEWGVDLGRLVLVPQAGAWLETVAALIEGLDVVLAPAPAQIAPAAAQRLAARLRSRSATLVVVGDWPRPQAAIRSRTLAWYGLGKGHGHIAGQRIEVSVSAGHVQRRVTVVRGSDGVALG